MPSLSIPVFRLLLTLVALVFFYSAVSATTAEEFDNLPVSNICMNEMLSLSHIVDARDKGVPKAKIVEFSKTVPAKYAVPIEAIDNVYAFPSLNAIGHTAYALWACHARTYGLPIKPLSLIEERLRSCTAKPGNDPCNVAIRNAALGLPEGFTPRRSAPPVAAFKQ